MSSRPCQIPGCAESRFAKRLCRMHYERMKKGRPMELPRYASRLTAAAIEEIKTSARSVSELAVEHGISRNYAQLIRSGKKVPNGR